MSKLVYVYALCKKGGKSNPYRCASVGDLSIYEAMDFILANPSKLKKTEYGFPKTKLASIINLHNAEGIKNPHLIHSFIMTLKLGLELVTKKKLPNVRLTKTPAGKLVLFDGHHSMLAYFFAGKKYLHDIPHMIIVNDKTGHVSDDEIGIFFGKHASKFKNNAWSDYAINWQAPKSKQLCKRIQKNMGELHASLAGSLE